MSEPGNITTKRQLQQQLNERITEEINKINQRKIFTYIYIFIFIYIYLYIYIYL
ncbi:hypothetical protein DDB_G0293688 [Dictyostelium discoideum AX4]|uniref:Uncharacterized protein n=1 Tax=Dictyostelium discoideum TaxID=44689 RepID=Q54BI4_DICDI|nr:hypothetical protein DDB_G0293688 [Dictyostelium discoideum AX4]EAL60656.1 hypothetical protein DDB_G0293688 [Dictyostelium discoideum AX4]|eukprot:XP_629045.1 hypothetical protein DDB_G0293688 [Dictyostelium discoideum AX4]